MMCRPRLLLVLWLVLGTSLEASSTLIFPRLSFAPEDLIGIAIVNPGEETATVTFTAYGVNGQVVAGEGSSTASTGNQGKQPQGAFTNPVPVDIPPGQQFAEVTIGIFGPGTDPEAIGWIEATSPADDLTGFFQVLNFPAITFLDGADLPVPDSRLIFQDVRVDGGFSTTAYLLNPNGPGTASVKLSLVTPESVKTKSLQIAAKGIVELNVEEFFEGVEPTGQLASEAYLIAESNVEIAGFELVGKEGEDLLGLNARPASELLTTLIFPQLAVLGPFITEAVIGNFSEEATIVTLTAYQPNGDIYADEVQNNPVVVALDPGEILRADLEEIFGFSEKATAEPWLEGWLKVESTSASINGSISYSIPSLGTIASVSSVRQGSRRALISHLGTADPFFTGLAILNAGALAANVRVVALTKEGEVLGTFTTTLQPGERISKPVTDLIAGAGGQNGGMLWIESDVPVYLTAIFGSATVFANVPPQPVPESFQPDMGIDQIGVTPPLAVLSPAQVQQFELEGSTTVPLWGVNGQPGGTLQTGTISGTGLYTAPAVIPMALPVTIMAAADNQTAGASVDVQTKTLLVGGLGIVQSVAYLAGLERLYTSELSFGASPSRRKSLQGSEQSTIFDVTTGSQQSVAVFGDDISKMIAYAGADGKEYLLLAGRTSGSIRRLDPGTGTSVEVASGLNAPNSLVIDPVSGDLLIAEADQVSTIPASQVNQGLTSAGLAEVEIPSGARQLAAGLEPTGIAVDRCTGNVYVSQASTGEVLEIDRLTGEVRVIAEGLSEPGQLLGFYRSDISCPDAFHLLVIETFFFPEEEREASQITLLVPSTGGMTLWLAESSVVIPDITLLPPGSTLGSEAVLLAENAVGEGQISKVEIIGRYDPTGINPPEIENCLGTVTIADPSLDSAIRGSLGIGPQDPITCQMALSVTSLTATNLGITSLTGLEGFTNLEVLNLSRNQISDLSPLTGLTQLHELHLEGVYRSFCNFGKGELKDQRSGAGFLQKLKARARRIRMAPDPKDRLPRELLKELIEEGSEAFRGVLEKLFNTAMQMEREEFLGARRWERSEQRRDHANGYKDKTLSTRVGQLRIRIPQVRHLDFYPRSLERGCRSEKALKLAIAEMYVMGVSTRKVTEITEQLCGTEISASQVSRISKLLDDELEQFRNRPLGSYPVVYLDAHYEKVRRQGSIQDVAVLKATGVNCWGKREVIGISCRLSEAEAHWREFLQQLQKRGLEGVQLIVSDDHSGLRAARRSVFPSVPWQRCQFHLSQNAQRYARRSDQRAAIATDIRDIFNAPSGGEAEAMLRTRVEQYRDRNPELADWMETNLPEGFTVFRFARSTWRRIRTNNGLENLNRQIRRRTRVVGIFPNTESALRLITAVVEEIHEDWLIGKQYLSLVDFKPQENPISDHSQSNYRKTVA